jgi:hypothetical protein
MLAYAERLSHHRREVSLVVQSERASTHPFLFPRVGTGRACATVPGLERDPYGCRLGDRISQGAGLGKAPLAVAGKE